MGSPNLLLYGAITFFILPVVAATAYVFFVGKKQKKLLKLFQAIKTESSNKSAREETADQAIQILHANKRLAPPSPILLNIQNADDLIVSYELLKAEIRFLLKIMDDSLRSPKSYLNLLRSNEGMEVLKFLENAEKLIKQVDFMQLPHRSKAQLLYVAYSATLKMCLLLPDENVRQKLKYNTLFVIIDQTPNHTFVLFP